MSKKKKKPPVDHTNCECVVRQRGPHWGLFCTPHNAYIKFLSRQEQQVIKTMDIGWIADPAQAPRLSDLQPRKFAVRD